MKRDELIERFKALGYSKREAKMFLQDFVDIMIRALAEGEDIPLHGFGLFTAKDVDAKEMRNPVSGEHMSIPAHKYPKFTPGSTLRRAVREGLVRD